VREVREVATPVRDAGEGTGDCGRKDPVVLMSTPLKADIMQLPGSGRVHNAWNGVPGSMDTILFANNDLNNSWYLGFRNSITIGGPNTIPVPPSGTVTLTGNRTVYAIAANGTTALVIIPGGGAYFQGLTQGQGSLVLPSIHSPNFVGGVSGWTINKDGSAEFNNLTVRGTFRGPSMIIDATGIYMYNGAPAFGNSPVFAAAVPGTVNDPVGNALSTTSVLTFIQSGVISAPAAVPQIQLDGARNALLNYDAAANLLAAIAGVAGTDFFGHTYPAGLFGQQLTLQNQGSAPPAFTGGSVIYSSTAGRPRYKSSAGADNVIERADVNVSTFTVGNTTTPTNISAPLNYQANEGNQGSEYEIEIDGVLTTTNGVAQTATFGLAVDGTILGGQFTIGAVFLAINLTFSFTLRARLTIVTSGVSGTANTVTDGQIIKQGVNIGSAASGISEPLGAVGTGKTFDSTIAHTIQIMANFGGAAAGQQIQAFRSRITRRF